MTGGGLTCGGGCIYTARNRTGWGQWWLLRGEAIYFLSGMEMREGKKTEMQAEKEVPLKLTTQRGYSVPFFFF